MKYVATLASLAVVLPVGVYAAANLNNGAVNAPARAHVSAIQFATAVWTVKLTDRGNVTQWYTDCGGCKPQPPIHLSALTHRTFSAIVAAARAEGFFSWPLWLQKPVAGGAGGGAYDIQIGSKKVLVQNPGPPGKPSEAFNKLWGLLMDTSHVKFCAFHKGWPIWHTVPCGPLTLAR